MFASASRLMATTLRAPAMPAMCWTAPLMPMVMYRSGATVAPVRPTWCDGGTQPASVTARVAPTAPPSSCASSSTTCQFSGPPRPRPPETMTLASFNFGRLVALKRAWPQRDDLGRAADRELGDGAAAEDRLGDDELTAVDPQGSRIGDDAAAEP